MTWATGRGNEEPANEYIVGMRSTEDGLPTIEDVAAAAGVSTATVSRVLNRRR